MRRREQRGQAVKMAVSWYPAAASYGGVDGIRSTRLRDSVPKNLSEAATLALGISLQSTGAFLLCRLSRERQLGGMLP